MRRHLRFLAIPIALFALAWGASPGPSAGSDEPQWLELPTKTPAGPPTPLPTMTTLDIRQPGPESALPTTPITSANIADLSLARTIGRGQATSVAFHSLAADELLFFGGAGLAISSLGGAVYGGFTANGSDSDLSPDRHFAVTLTRGIVALWGVR